MVVNVLQWENRVSRERIVSVGFLTERDLALLGEGFDRHFAIPQDDLFADLITQLNEIKIGSLDGGAVVKASKAHGRRAATKMQ